MKIPRNGGNDSGGQDESCCRTETRARSGNMPRSRFARASMLAIAPHAYSAIEYALRAYLQDDDRFGASSRCMQDFQDPLDSGTASFYIVLPNANYSDALTPQQASDSSVSIAIPTYLLRPECRILTWGLKASWTTMPKASVNEYRGPIHSKVKVGSPDDFRRMKGPATNPAATQECCKGTFRASISARPYCSHHGGPLHLCEHIHRG